MMAWTKKRLRKQWMRLGAVLCARSDSLGMSLSGTSLKLPNKGCLKVEKFRWGCPKSIKGRWGSDVTARVAALGKVTFLATPWQLWFLTDKAKYRRLRLPKFMAFKKRQILHARTK